MRIRKLLFISIIIIFTFSCQKKIDNNQQKNTKQIPLQEIFPKITTDSNTPLTVIAYPITYDVIVKAPNDDEWTKECLQNTDRQKLIDILFHKVISGELKAHQYLTDTIIPVDSIKALYKRYPLSKVGKLQFEEEWYFDTLNDRFYKRVKSIIFGYELRDNTGEVYGYKPGFKIYLK